MRLSPLADDQSPLVQPLAARAFEDLAARQGRPLEESTPDVVVYYARQHAHLVRTGRALGAFDDDDDLVGVAMSYERDGLWVLALLVVEPGRQSSGAGSALLRASLEGAPHRRLLHASRDERALRAYSRAGFRLLPALEARGIPALDGPAVRDVAPDGPLADDLTHAVDGGDRLLALADGRPGRVLLAGPAASRTATVLAAPDDVTAADLLRGALAAADGPVRVGPIAPQEHWAVAVALDAGLALGVTGPVAVAGATHPLSGPLAPQAVYV